MFRYIATRAAAWPRNSAIDGFVEIGQMSQSGPVGDAKKRKPLTFLANFDEAAGHDGVTFQNSSFDH
jgi:hypothetical protein